MPNRNAQDAILAKKQASARAINPKKRKVLRSKVRQLLTDAIREDQRSAELRYRYGYFLMDEGEYNKAIQYFEKALEKNGIRNCTMPLTPAQVYKAHMFIGYCGGQILKGSLEKVSELGIEDASIRSLQVDGRGVDEVFELLKNQSEYYYVIEKRGQELREKMISVEEYKSYLDEPTDCVIFSFVERKPFIMYADEETIFLPPAHAELYNFLLHYLSFNSFISYEQICQLYEEKPWRTMRDYKNELNQWVKSFPPFADQDFLLIPQGQGRIPHPKEFVLGDIPSIIITRKPTIHSYVI